MDFVSILWINAEKIYYYVSVMHIPESDPESTSKWNLDPEYSEVSVSDSDWALLDRCTDGPGQSRWWRNNLTVEPRSWLGLLGLFLLSRV